MVEIGPKRIAGSIEPFRVEPGRKVRLRHDFGPAAGSGRASKREAKDILALIQIDPKYSKVSKEQRTDLQAAKVVLMAQAPKGRPADPIEAERVATAEASGQKHRSGTKGKGKAGKASEPAPSEQSEGAAS